MKRNRILLIDNDEIVLVGLKEELKSAGYNVRTALSGEKAIEMIKEERTDIVFTDLVMPGMNGVEICKRLKTLYPDIVVILISGHPKEIEKHQIDFNTAGGIDEFLRKPLLENEILEIAEKTFRKLR